MGTEYFLERDKKLYFKCKILFSMFNLSGWKTKNNLMIIAYKVIKDGSDFKDAMMEAAVDCEIKIENIRRLIMNANNRAWENNVTLYKQITKQEEKLKPKAFLFLFVEFLRANDFVEKKDKKGILHTYFSDKKTHDKIKVLN